MITALLAAAPGSVRAAEPPAPVYLRCARLFDGSSGALRRAVTVVVQDGRIQDVGEAIAVPEGALQIDLGDRTAMPGLIDAHTHIALHPGGYDDQILRETPEFRALWAAVDARATVEAGITTIRDLGNEGAGFADVALRDAVAKGLLPGPRILAAIQPVSATGSYGLVGLSPYLRAPSISYEADGPDAVRRQVRTLVRQGADVIKVYMESYEKRQSDPDRLSGARNFSDAELSALVEEAHAAGLKVAAHTYSDAAANRALDAGVDSIEHGLYLEEATFRRMAARGVAYVPTLLVYEYWRDGRIFGAPSADTRRKLETTVREHTATFQRALRTPVRIVFGSDTFELPGTNAGELELMVRYGMPPADALRAATSRAAELLGLSGTIGTIGKGAAADVIALDGDPLTDISAVRRVSFVMKDGRVLVRDGRPVPR